MHRVLRPLALCVFLMFGALPVAAFACQWTCATRAAEPGQAGHQGHTGHALQASQNRVDTLIVQSTTASCDHVSVADPAIASGTQMLIAVSVDRSTCAAAPTLAGPRAAAVATGTHSPPGTRTVPLPLRV